MWGGVGGGGVWGGVGWGWGVVFEAFVSEGTITFIKSKNTRATSLQCCVCACMHACGLYGNSYCKQLNTIA